MRYILTGLSERTKHSFVGSVQFRARIVQFEALTLDNKWPQRWYTVYNFQKENQQKTKLFSLSKREWLAGETDQPKVKKNYAGTIRCCQAR